MRLGLLATVILAPIFAFAGAQKYDVSIDGMTCDSCVKTVTQALSKVPHVDPATVKVVLKEKKASLTVNDDSKESVDAIKKAVESVGYKVTTVNTPAAKDTKKN